MGLELQASEDDLMSQAIRQNPPSTDPQFSGQPEISDDFDTMPSIPPIVGGVDPNAGGLVGSPPIIGGGLSGVANEGQAFGVPPGQAPLPLGQQPNGQNATPKEEKPGATDIFFKAVSFGCVNTYKYIKELILSIRTRNIEDWSILANRWITIGSVSSIIGIISIIAGVFGDLSILKLGGIGGISLIGGLITLASGIGGLGVSTYLRIQGGQFAATGGSFDELQEFNVENVATGGFDDIEKTTADPDMAPSYLDEDEDEDEEDDYKNILKDLGIYDEDEEDDLEKMFEPEDTAPKQIDYDSLVDKIPENMPLITRKFLWDTFKPYFPQRTVGFSKVIELDTEEETALVIGSKINKAMKTLCPKALDEDIECVVTKVIESFFSYEVTFTRPKTKLTLAKLEEELVNYFTDGSTTILNIKVRVVGDTLIAVIPKGVAAPVTIGDCFSVPKVEEYFTSDKRQFPFIVGVTQLGDVELLDARSITSFLISGKPRSGKSAYVNSILLELVTMNTPEDVQFVVIDPKNSMLFKTFALMPHVVGIHQEDNIIAVLKAVLDGEGKRRERLLADNRAENIWELRNKKNVKIPVLYIVIDEVVSVIEGASLNGTDKEIKSLISMILTQLPSTGIGLIMIPHRSTGILSPLTRNNIAYRCAVMADIKSVKEELGGDWSIPLTKPGEIAALNNSYEQPKYVRGTCPVDPDLGDDSDPKVREIMANIARTWYKMGVEIPTMPDLGVACNRDEDFIRKELEITLNPNKVQYDLDLDGLHS